VYPTLQWLEDEGLVSAKDIEGKKVYEITDAGRAFLEEHRDVVDDIFERVRDAVDQALGGAMGELNEAVGRLMKTAYRTAWRSRDEAIRRKIAETLRRAAAEIEALTSEATSRRS
jgi:DNA-binding PadR family transcriptional regulator